MAEDSENKGARQLGFTRIAGFKLPGRSDIIIIIMTMIITIILILILIISILIICIIGNLNPMCQEPLRAWFCSFLLRLLRFLWAPEVPKVTIPRQIKKRGGLRIRTPKRGPII